VWHDVEDSQGCDVEDSRGCDMLLLVFVENQAVLERGSERLGARGEEGRTSRNMPEDDGMFGESKRKLHA
jgi:hypothetical protein